METTSVDERDTVWEIEKPIFRVLSEVEGVFSSYDVRSASFGEVREWADRLGGRFGIAVKIEQGVDGDVGLIWVIPPPTP